jgi:DNA polymerase III alpha subunit
MVAKTKINDYGDCVYTESDLLELIYQNPDLDISNIHLDNTEKYMNALKELGVDLPPVIPEPKNHIPLQEFDKANTQSWFMPAQYETIDVEQWLLDKCQNQIEKDRVSSEMSKFREKEFVQVLQFLIYFVDTMRANNIVWGVGRGSSVASFCLFLIGVHKINPLLYKLDITEFLR